jgi:hypothetical protein
MNTTKIQTTAITQDNDPLSPADKEELRERLETEARRFLQERRFGAPSAALSILDEAKETSRSLAVKVVRRHLQMQRERGVR